MRTTSLLAGLVLAGLLLAAPAAAASDRTISVYEPRQRTAEELLPLARAALGDRGQVLLDVGTGSLLLVGRQADLDEAVSLLRRQDRALRTVVLQYESRRRDSLEARGIRVDWSAELGNVRVGNVRLPPGESGVRIGGFAVGTEREGGTGGMLRVLEGRSGRITTGRSVPVTRRSRWEVETTWVTAESGFEVRPRVLGDGRVQVELVPMEASVDDAGQVRFTEAATTVTLRPGETIVVGSVDRSSDVQRRGSRVIRASERSEAERVLLLSVQVEGAAPAAREDADD